MPWKSFCNGRREVIGRSCLNPAFLCLVVIECGEKDNNCDGEEDQNRPISCLGHSSVVHQAVIRDAVVSAEFFEGGVEAMDMVGKKPPRSNHDEGQDDLSDYERIHGPFMVPQPPRVDRNHCSVNDNSGGGEGREDRDNESIALEFLKVIIQDTVGSVDIVGSSSVSQDDREVRVGRVETGDGQREESEEEDGKASPDHILGRHCRGGRLSIEGVGSLKADWCL
jgi:hypothetical protein